MGTASSATVVDPDADGDERASTDADEPILSGFDDIVLVSNRQPYSHGYDDDGEVVVDRPAGGLTAGLDPVLQQTDGTWIAWGDGEADKEVSEDGRVRVPPGDPAYTLDRLWLSEADLDGYYYGFSNQVLWPICHGLPSNLAFERSDWECYRDVNRRFAERVADRASGDSLVWFQDYHLALAPQMARESLPEETCIAQFWHIPWPAAETFRACPHSEELLRGLLGNDLLGFHVERYCRAFFDSVEMMLPEATVDRDEGTVRFRGRTTTVRAFPLGVDAERIARLAASAGDEFWDEFCERHGIPAEAKVLVGVDRLDYTKGIPQRLEAVERLLENRPELRGKVVYVQKACESRSSIPAYRRLHEKVRSEVERINERFATDDWRPVVHLERMLPTEELYGLYRHGDAALVSAVRDGMNLVAKEYAAAQIDEEGVLLLSELTGAHDELGEAATTITPYDVDEFADRIAESLAAPVDRRRERMRALRRSVFERDLDAWMRDVFAAAADVAPANSGDGGDGRGRS